MEPGASVQSIMPRGDPWRALAGPLLTVAGIAVIELLRPTPLHFPGPSVALMIVVAFSTYVGGFLPGITSCALAITYGTWFFLVSAPEFDASNVRRFVDLALGAPGIMLMMGLLRRRAQHSRRTAADAAVARQYVTLFEEAGEPMLLSDSSNRYVFVNRRACEISGYSREELLRMRVGDLVSPQSLAERPLRMDELKRRGELRTPRELVRRDGTTLRVEVTARRLPDGQTLAILRDVTEERESVERLHEALSLVRATLESTTDGILVVDSSGRWAGYNRKFGDMWHMPVELMEKGDDDRALEHALSQVESPESFILKVRELYATPDASSFDEIRLKDGRVIERYSIPQRIGERVVGRVWSFRDVTAARRQAEALRATETHMVRTEKLEAVGRLAGGVAHDFNNMLTAILGEADLLLMNASLEPRARAQIESIREAGLRSAQLTHQLLAFARRQHTEPRPFELAELVRSLEPIIQRLVGESVRTRVEVNGNGRPAWIHADPGQFEQAILNLVINAGDAMPDGGELVVRVGREHVEPAARTRRGARRDGPHACISVSDTGSGIPPEALPYVFEPFFTTKAPGKGTGLGLASVHGIIESAHGFIEVESTPGRGTTFHVLVPEHALPDGAGVPQAGAPAADSADYDDVRPAVLVVDDEPQVRHFVAAVLAEAGVEVVQAAGADEAIRLAGERAEPLALLLSDVVMPGTSGPELARRLLAEGSVRRVMFMSGYTGPALREQLADLAAVSLIHKPFRSDELLERVRSALDLAGPRANRRT
jgi:PAS domain S-box-containing protein